MVNGKFLRNHQNRGIKNLVERKKYFLMISNHNNRIQVILNKNNYNK